MLRAIRGSPSFGDDRHSLMNERPVSGSRFRLHYVRSVGEGCPKCGDAEHQLTALPQTEADSPVPA